MEANMNNDISFSNKEVNLEFIKRVEIFKDLFLLKSIDIEGANILEDQESLSFFKIPNYQRPYSWEVNKENSQVERFFLDIQEYANKDYYLGHFLFEKNQKEDRYKIVDGQQRLTTIILFLKAIYDIDSILVNKELYFIKDSEYILEVIDYDIEYYNEIINGKYQDVDESSDRFKEIKTSSARKMILAKKYFDKKLKEQKNSMTEVEFQEVLKSYVRVIEEARVSTSLIDNRVIANQVFIFHNNRGKKLENLDLLKSFLINVVNSSSISNKDSIIKNSIDVKFKKIFETCSKIEYLSFHPSEDAILNYHFQLKFGHSFNFSNFEKAIAEVISGKSIAKYGLVSYKEENFKAKLESFINNLSESYQLILDIVRCAEINNTIANVLVQGGGIEEYSLLLALAYYKNPDNWENDLDIKKALKLMEINLFKQNFCGITTRANYFGYRATDFYNDDNYTIDILLAKLKLEADIGFKWWWNLKDNFIKYFDFDKIQNFYDDKKNTTKYLLWKYENYLRCQKYGENVIKIAEYKKTSKDRGIFSSIEHIYPRNPKKDNNDKEDDESKKIGSVVNEIGNLIALDLSSNQSLQNKMPIDKYTEFNSNIEHHKKVLYEIKEGNWNYENLVLKEQQSDNQNNFILHNSKRIKNFALAYFSYHPVCLENNEFVNCENYSNLVNNFVAIERDEVKDNLSIKENVDEFNLKFF